MRVEQKAGITFLYADDTKKIKHKEKDNLYSVLALAKSDSPDNYEEVDELWGEDIYSAPSDFESFDILPDTTGSISYQDAQKLLNTITILRKRNIDLQNQVDDVTDRVSEIEKLLKESSI